MSEARASKAIPALNPGEKREGKMTKQAVVRAMAEVMAGLQMPISLGMQLGTAREPWGKLKDLAGFGWHDADEFERVLNQALAHKGE